MNDDGSREGLVPLPLNENQSCFGCSPTSAEGLHMTFQLDRERRSVVSRYMVPEHLCGWANIVHGGIVTTLLDEVMGWAALVILRKPLLSKSISVDFLKPVLTGSEIRVEGSVLEVRSEKEAVMQGAISDTDGQQCARSSSVIKLFSLEQVQALVALDPHTLAYLEQLWSLSP